MTACGPATHGYEAIVVGGGHNGLVAAAYLAKAGLKVAVLEGRESLGGPCGSFEFMPGYRTSLTNSPGSFDSRFVQELELQNFGLRFVRTDPTVIHPFPKRCFVGWRDPGKIAEQLDAFAPGEGDRYFQLLKRLEVLGQHLVAAGASIYAPSPSAHVLADRLPRSQARLFEQVFHGSLRDLLDEELKSEEAKALLGMVAINAGLARPSSPGTAIGLMLRPLSLASSPALDPDDPRRTALRGSTGLPVGGMGAIVDALEAFCLSRGVTFHRNTPVAQVLHRQRRVIGVASASGDEYHAPVVVAALNPKTLFTSLLDDEAVGAEIRRDVGALPMRGSAFKLALGLDGVPSYAGLPPGLGLQAAASCQFRIAPSLDSIDRAIADGLAGRTSRRPLMWGLLSSLTSPGVAPKGRHLLSVNVWHAPYELANGSWDTEKETFGRRCIAELGALMPDLERRIVDFRFMGPRDLESEFGLVGSNITHGDMWPDSLFGGRPHRAAHAYRTPLAGLYLSGAGTWPGGYVTGVPGFNASQAVITDLRADKLALA
ncbi:MAG TPA: NAD(P)/FAD-dependent oxidoreductase [Ramlibacter sp.]|nr:NAD(P)/FAD-dependent oxidoreductase [Ramlibacter sp.]